MEQLKTHLSLIFCSQAAWIIISLFCEKHHEKQLLKVCKWKVTLNYNSASFFITPLAFSCRHPPQVHTWSACVQWTPFIFLFLRRLRRPSAECSSGICFLFIFRINGWVSLHQNFIHVFNKLFYLPVLANYLLVQSGFEEKSKITRNMSGLSQRIDFCLFYSVISQLWMYIKKKATSVCLEGKFTFNK